MTPRPLTLTFSKQDRTVFSLLVRRKRTSLRKLAIILLEAAGFPKTRSPQNRSALTKSALSQTLPTFLQTSLHSGPQKLKIFTISPARSSGTVLQWTPHYRRSGGLGRRIPWADHLSKLQRTEATAMVNCGEFRRLNPVWGAFDTDLIASHTNDQVPHYMSCFFTPTTAGVDAFRFHCHTLHCHVSEGHDGKHLWKTQRCR